jgi:hypothetical protein
VNSRRLVLLLVALGILVALAVAVSVSQRAGTDNGQVLLPDLKAQLNAIDKIIVRSGGNKTVATLARQKDGWVLNEQHGYAADVGKVRKNLIALAEAKILEEKTSNPELYGKLGVDDIAKETAGGVQLDLAAGDKVVAVIIGNTGVGGGERAYARRAGEPASWLINGSFELPRETIEWLDRTIINIPPKRIQAVTIIHPEGPAVRLEKASADAADFTVLNVPKGRSIAFPGVGNAIGAGLSDLTLETVEPAAGFTPGYVAPTVTRFETFDGLVVEATIYQPPSGLRVGFKASADQALAERFTAKPAAAVPAGEKPDENAPKTAPVAWPEKPKTFDEVKAEAAELNARLGPWLYTLPDFKLDQLLKKPEELLQPLPAKTAVPKKGG